MMNETTIVSEVQSKAILIRKHLNHFTYWFFPDLQNEDDDIYYMDIELYSEEFNNTPYLMSDRRFYSNGVLTLHLNGLKDVIQSKSESLSEHAYNLTRHQIDQIIKELRSRIQDLKTQIEEKHIKLKGNLTDWSEEDFQLMCDFELNRFEKHEVKYVSDLEDMVNRLLPPPEAAEPVISLGAEQIELPSFILVLGHLGIIDAIKKDQPNRPNIDYAKMIKSLFGSQLDDITAETIRTTISRFLNEVTTKSENILLFNPKAVYEAYSYLRQNDYSDKILLSFFNKANSINPISTKKINR